MKKITVLFPVFLFIFLAGNGQGNTVYPGAWQLNNYLPLLKGKKISVFANPTSVIHHTHLVDTLLHLGVSIVKIFGPEHGFRGTADAGAHVANYTDQQTGIPVVSLYGKKVRPSEDDLKDVEVMLFDLQDVGVRFYTYINALQEYIESAIINNKPLIVLDRPNPNGFYVDGPVLNRKYSSGIGMQPVPVVYGMTIGEYAKMLVGEQWLTHKPATGKGFSLTVIPCKNYTHKSLYRLPVKPSPNLPDMTSIYLYPSTCFFEGTVLSEGRGTEHPFALFGHPSLPDTLYAFTPRSKEGATAPKLKDVTCYGWNVYTDEQSTLQTLKGQLHLSWLLNAYALFPDKEDFFINAPSGKPEDYFFNKLTGNSNLMQQLIQGFTETEIRNSWQPDLTAFKKIRKKYLLYADF
ncbi:Uncharacterized conserved protein YbbC, DUF1343 family [Filimonas lacunae]|uniref:Uncharacterized conserved protein YbbC, DUF1343 family n=1 Tax=Filimonas lacunae TaxID=477680 RepID=A0A173MLS6_9BACT|nr:DUF1343 domain-containing protein [Filimonas lacunae]BAV08419.1 hypothetical protein FLA_4460 [Filimonas lacunae]SIT33899.1 Uncharacterized conserved protein YbbC, DUF1343 family [Filimonas lacunae]